MSRATREAADAIAVRVPGEVARDRGPAIDHRAERVAVVGVDAEVGLAALVRARVPRMMVAEHEHRNRGGRGELIEPLELVARDAAAVGAGARRVEHREGDAVELDREVPGRDLFGAHRVVVAADVTHAVAEPRVRVEERLVLRFGAEVREIALHDDRVGIEPRDLVDRTRVHHFRVRRLARFRHEHRAELLGRPELAALLLAEVHVVDGRDRREEATGRPRQRRHRRRQQRRRLDPVDASGNSVAGSSPVIATEWYGPVVVTSWSPTLVVTDSPPSVRNVTTTSSGPTVKSSAS